MLVKACRAPIFDAPPCEDEDEDDEDEVGMVTERVADGKERISVDPGIGLGRDAGMATGQKLHTSRP